jgi:hypothetical protein
MLDKALRIDPHCANALSYKQAILKRPGGKNLNLDTAKQTPLKEEQEQEQSPVNNNLLDEDTFFGSNLDFQEDETETDNTGSRISGAVERSEKAMHDASLEQAFMSGNVPHRSGELHPFSNAPPPTAAAAAAASASSGSHDKYPLVFDADTLAEESKRARKRSRHSRKGGGSYSDKDDESDASSRSSEREREKRRKKKNKKRDKEKKRKRHKRRKRS